MEETEKRRWLGIKVTSKHSGYIWPVWAAPQGEPPSPSSVGTVALEVHHAPPVWLLGTGAPSRRILSAEGWRLVPLQNCWGERVGTGADDGGPWKHPWNGHERKKQEWQLGGGGAELLWWSSGDDVTFQSRGAGAIPGQRAKILHASWPKKQNIKQKQCSNKFNKDFKNVP